jgi:hypothetical protein
MKMTAKADSERFQSGANEYAVYLDTPEGRLRSDLAFRNLLRAMLAHTSLAAFAERGVRVLADYLPPRVSRSADYERICELERRLGSRPEYAAVARYAQCFARLP